MNAGRNFICCNPLFSLEFVPKEPCASCTSLASLALKLVQVVVFCLVGHWPLVLATLLSRIMWNPTLRLTIMTDSGSLFHRPRCVSIVPTLSRVANRPSRARTSHYKGLGECVPWKGLVGFQLTLIFSVLIITTISRPNFKLMNYFYEVNFFTPLTQC